MKERICVGYIRKFLFSILASVIILLLLLIPVFFSFIILHFSIRNSDTERSDERSISTYQYYKYNPIANSSSFGVITSYDELTNENDFVSYEDEYGNLVLFSNIGSSEYRCVGHCVCDEESDFDIDTTTRRTTIGSRIMVRGLMYLTVSTSAFFAANKAKRFFRQECETRFDGFCKSSDIRSEVDDCEKVIHIDFQKEERERKEQRHKLLNTKFLCKGNCLGRKFTRELGIKNKDGTVNFEAQRYEHIASSYGCEELELEKLEVLHQYTDFIDQLDGEPIILAISVFTAASLNDFCIENSGGNKATEGPGTEMEYFCVGHLESGNPTVWCRELEAGDKEEG